MADRTRPLGLDLRFALEDEGDDSGGGDGGDIGRGPRLVASFTPTEAHRGRPGFLHGGVAAACLDETMAGLSWALDRRRVVTATLELKYRRPVPLDGTAVRLEAWRPGPSPRRVLGRLLLADGRVAVDAKGIFVELAG